MGPFRRQPLTIFKLIFLFNHSSLEVMKGSKSPDTLHPKNPYGIGWGRKVLTRVVKGHFWRHDNHARPDLASWKLWEVEFGLAEATRGWICPWGSHSRLDSTSRRLLKARSEGLLGRKKEKGRKKKDGGNKRTNSHLYSQLNNHIFPNCKGFI